MTSQLRQTHLEFYRQHKITPVHYDLSHLDKHFERRFSLYVKLGLLPLACRGAKVLEVAAGTGQNSLYIAQLMPAQLVLLEPNLPAIEHIYNLYANFQTMHTAPEIVCATLEEYLPKDTFDIVICENWLGTSEHELSLLQKLVSMVSLQGIVVLTTVSPIGFVPNLLRRYLASYIAPLSYRFEQRTALLTEAYTSHLSTLLDMNRSVTDWVQDNMINPAYFGLCLSIPYLLEHLSDQFEIINSCPSFYEDWQWFKGLHGKQRQSNKHFLNQYWSKAHNFIDYREQSFMRDSIKNIELEKRAITLLKSIEKHEDACFRLGGISSEYASQIVHLLDDFIAHVSVDFIAAIRGLQEVRSLIMSPKLINTISVANMKNFGALFGRETVYVSLMGVKK